MIIFTESKAGKQTLNEGNVLICRNGVVGVTTIPQTNSGLKIPNGYILAKNNIGSIYHIANSGTLVKVSEKSKYIYENNGELVFDENKVTFTAQAMKYLGCPISRR